MKNFRFWQRWLFYSSLLFALCGILLAVGVANSYRQFLGQLFFHNKMSPESKQLFAFLSAPENRTMACAYVLLAYLAWFPFRRKEKWARNAIVIAFGIWFVIDSAACIRYGAYFQLYVINGISFLQKFLPLAFTWNAFATAPSAVSREFPK